MMAFGNFDRAIFARFFLKSIACVAIVACHVPAFAQQTVPTSAGNSVRKLAADALEVVAPDFDPGDTSEGMFSLDFIKKHPEIAWKSGKGNYTPASKTLLAMSKEIVFRREVWCMEIAFKPVRMIEIEVPQPGGGSKDKVVWYLLYRLRYVGGDLRPEPEKDKFGNDVVTEPRSESDLWRRIFPTFTINSRVSGKLLVDRVIPNAKRAIELRERVGQRVYDSIEMQTIPIKLSTPQENNEVWGVATWTDVEPSMNFFSVDIRGITNAQRLEVDGQGKNQFLHKTLVLHFFRPGDTINQVADPVLYGIPALSDPSRQKYVLEKFGVDRRLDHVWVYR